MHRDDKLIFEAYSPKTLLTEENNQFLAENFPNLITEEEKEGWLWTAAKVLDPTGVLSYGDLSRAYNNYVEDQNVINFGLLLLGIFNALPNFGLLAAGVGGVGWAGLKAMIKGASKNPKLITKAVEELFRLVRVIPGAKSTLVKGIEKAASSGVIKSPAVKNNLIEAIEKGALPSSMTAVGKKTGTLTRPALRSQAAALKGLDAAKGELTKIGAGAASKFKKQGASRFLSTFGPSGLGSTYPGWAPQSVAPKEWEQKIGLRGQESDSFRIETPGGSSRSKEELLNYIRQNRG